MSSGELAAGLRGFGDVSRRDDLRRAARHSGVDCHRAARARLGYVGHFFSFGLGQFAFGVAILRVSTLPRWLGWLSFVPALLLGWLAILLELSGRSTGPVVPIGILGFVVWMLATAYALLRWKPAERTLGRSRE